MTQTNLLKLDRVQNEAIRVILGAARDTPTDTMRLDLPPMQTTPKVEQVKAYFSAVENPHSPFHKAVKDTQGCRLGRNKTWTGQAEDSLLPACQLTELKQTKEWEKYPNRFRRLYETLRLEYLRIKALPRMASRQNGVKEQEIGPLTQENSKPQDLIDWNVSMVDFLLRKLLWVYCPRHTGVKGNDRANTQAGKATLTSALLLGSSEVLRILRHCKRAQSRGHHTIDRLDERGVETGSARRSS